LRPVVRNAFYNGVSGAAVGTADKGIMESAVTWIEEFGKAITAKIYIGRDGSVGYVFCVTAEDGKIDSVTGLRSLLAVFDVNRVDYSKRWCLVFYSSGKMLQRVIFTLGVNDNACTGIDDTSGYGESCS
jgi:hypothetical protein